MVVGCSLAEKEVHRVQGKTNNYFFVLSTSIKMILTGNNTTNDIQLIAEYPSTANIL